MRAIIFLLCFPVIVSCTSLKQLLVPEEPSRFNLENYRFYNTKDYTDHLVSLGQTYLKTPGIQTVPLRTQDLNYLNSLFEKLVMNSELIFSGEIKPKFYVIKDRTPFYFSLPNGHFFLSLGLAQKYFQHENILVSILAYEIFRVFYNIYNVNIVVPTGSVATEKLMSMVRIDLDEKIEVNKWASYILRRAGYDEYSYLNWIQIQNKNTLDFSLQHGDVKNILREEFSFKNFLISRSFSLEQDKRERGNSSPEFYQLLTYLKRFRL